MLPFRLLTRREYRVANSLLPAIASWLSVFGEASDSDRRAADAHARLSRMRDALIHALAQYRLTPRHRLLVARVRGLGRYELRFKPAMLYAMHDLFQVVLPGDAALSEPRA